MKMNRFLAVIYALVAIAFLVTAASLAFEKDGLLAAPFLVLIAALVGFTAWERWHKPARQLTEDLPPAGKKPLSIARAAIYAVLLFVLDALVFNQFVVAFVTILIVLPTVLYRAFVDRKDRPVLKTRLITAGILLLMVLMIMTANGMNNRLARQRTLYLASACEKYKADHGGYPDRLSDLVPRYIPEVPPAKFTIVASSFIYLSRADRHTIIFTAIPPFGRITYTLEGRSWGMID